MNITTSSLRKLPEALATLVITLLLAVVFEIETDFVGGYFRRNALCNAASAAIRNSVPRLETVRLRDCTISSAFVGVAGRKEAAIIQHVVTFKAYDAASGQQLGQQAVTLEDDALRATH